MTTTTYTYDENSVSDLYKDAFGFRPRENFWAAWNASGPDEKQAEWDYLINEMKSTCDEEKAHEDRAVAVFEEQITHCLAYGAKSREIALRWLMEASKADGDWEYFCFLNGLPYDYCK